MFAYLLKNLWSYIVVAACAVALTLWLSPTKIEEKIVTDVRERVIVRTIIKERPDGTKVTIIDERRDTVYHQDYSKITTRAQNTSIWLSQSLSGEHAGRTIYTLGITKHLLGGLSGGLYGRSDKEIGVLLSYSF